MSLLNVSPEAVALAGRLLAIPKPPYKGAWVMRDFHCYVGGYRDTDGVASFTIEWSAMYEAPSIGDTFEAMTRLSELFGTTKINLGRGTARYGCETCDHGSEYGTELTLLAPTNHVAALAELAGTRDYFTQGQVEEAERIRREASTGAAMPRGG